MEPDTEHLKPPKDVDLSETTENYLKRIYMLIESEGRARVSRIAAIMDRTPSSVSEAVKRMADDDYLIYEKYGDITLTDKGKEIAQGIHDNYSTLFDLLQALGIPKDTAMEDACSMEHSISKITIGTISNFIDFTEEEQTKELLERFKDYNRKELGTRLLQESSD